MPAPAHPTAEASTPAPHVPLRSMTGFATRRVETAGLAVRISIKSVNHRFLDLRQRAPAELEALAPEIEKLVRSRLRRGHVEIAIALERLSQAEARLDARMVGALRQAWQDLNAQLGTSDKIGAAEILRLPGVLTVISPVIGADDGQSETAAALLRGVEECLDALDRVRVAEGRALAADMAGRLAALRRQAAAVEPLREVVRHAIFERLQQRVAELAGGGAPPERILQEAALLAERSDVTEELTRLTAHLDQLADVLAAGGEAGKRLDFVLQELNREVNTMLSKSSGIAGAGLEITRLGIEMKAEVEKLREQVQNLE
jgi:uncharacterized protein (TIGR00255 family)